MVSRRLRNTPDSDELRKDWPKATFRSRTRRRQRGSDGRTRQADVAIVTGGDNGFNHIFVQPEIKPMPTCGAKQSWWMPRHGVCAAPLQGAQGRRLNKGDYEVKPVGGTTARLEAMTKDKGNAAAAVLNPPFTFRASEAGLKDMGTATKAVGAYQSDGAFVMRDWAKANSDVLVRYISAYVEGRRWALDPANKAEAIALLSERLKLTPQVAALVYAAATDPAEGMAKDAKFDMAGFANVLKLRAEIEGQWGGKPPAPEKYVDLSYYDRALSGLP